MMKFAQLLWVLLVLCVAPNTDAQAPFYEGKNILLVIGTDAGGSGDLRTRAILPALQKHIPGQPNIVVQYMPGVGGRKAANYLYKAVRPDGLTLGAFITGTLQGAILGETDAPYGFLTRKASGLNTKERLSTAIGVRVGAPQVGHSLYTMARMFAYMFDMKEPRFVTGYTPREVDFAIDKGEIDARASVLDSALTRNAHWFDKDLITLHATIDIPKGIKHTHPRLAHLAEIESFAKSNRDRRIIELFRGLRGVGQPFVAPPGTPPERVRILRDAMRKALADPEYAKNYEKLTSEPATPLSAEDFEKQLHELPRDVETIDLFKKFSSADPLPKR